MFLLWVHLAHTVLKCCVGIGAWGWVLKVEAVKDLGFKTEG